MERTLHVNQGGRPAPGGWWLVGSGHSLRDSSLSCPTFVSVSTEQSSWLCC